jgi:hypothetical protein
VACGSTPAKGQSSSLHTANRVAVAVQGMACTWQCKSINTQESLESSLGNRAANRLSLSHRCCAGTRAGRCRQTCAAIALVDNPAVPVLVPGSIGANHVCTQARKPHGQCSQGTQKGARAESATAQRVGGAKMKQACNAAHKTRSYVCSLDHCIAWATAATNPS